MNRSIRFTILFMLFIVGLPTLKLNSQTANFERNSLAGIQVTSTDFFNDAAVSLDSQFVAGGGIASASASDSFNGVSFSGSASASSNFGRLRNSGSGTVRNSSFDPENPWFDAEIGEINSDNTPDRYIAFGQSQYSDTFNYGSPTGNISAGVTVDFFFQITGTFSGEDAFFSIFVENDTDSDTILLSSNFDGPVINQTWVTKKFAIGADLSLNHRVTVNSQFDTFVGDYEDGSTISGSANFGSTVTLAQMRLFDETGARITEFTVDSASGTVYGIPEPGSGIMLGISGLLLFSKRRKTGRQITD